MDPTKLSPQYLEAHRIPGLPSSFYYIPNFITEAEAELLLSKARFLLTFLFRSSISHLTITPAPP